ncbi:uncharacterized protein LOC126775403 [Nymphalis io]|uniref:uncharacterized protein LOC126775403 n=1 Tax=Inachis io TaxID=171585 RepID=UPI00216A25E0|nr:uncharacterized protein LOC126775403 [Nymphalis io]XP_050353252.1 uncharacterized protein LOC126775403 [Nymphalis io]XP_050353253.1 uncharacterized protein LOC126775403 [Nymphalis io]
MDMEYDRKFEEMKKYIPFLESMIKRLENTSSVSNPRQAQLDKIRSLRDLLMDKKKRMKMENLLKCEQVLINLYEKVEQRDSLPVPKRDVNTSQKDKADLHIVRNKLKSAVIKLQTESVETLPEIARASETEEVCEPGSKEPALFQRRPNKTSMSPTRPVPNKIKEPSPQMSKRNYTRVLLSPEPNQNSWSTEENLSEKPLFSRRSPKNSARRRSPSYHKKERKKLSKCNSNLMETKDLNITLNVPEESLNSLNTKDILSRIINCSDNDVDIDTLRELRTQILGELKETGANEDISDLILKSYKKKAIKDKKAEEIEEGELSDSESEAIESIYGSLVIVDKEKSINVSNKISNEEPRKIQICLVINSDKNKLNSNKEEQNKILPVDSPDFETFSNKKQSEIRKDPISKDLGKITDESASNIEQITSVKFEDQTQEQVVANFGTGNKDSQKDERNEQQEIMENEIKPQMKIVRKEIEVSNFYNSVVEPNEDVNKYLPENQSSNKITQKSFSEQNIGDSCENTNVPNKTNEQNSNVEIPLLENTKKISEIDILQALKKEILSETNNVLSSDTVTPALHQPKITKVGNAHEIGSKKRISIENYKAKTNTPLKNILGNESSSTTNKDDINRKQSLKLTEKECERFNFPSKLTLGESSDDEDKSPLSAGDIYENLAPKSPDHEDFADTGIKPPIIIPSDPIQTTVVNSETDVDMRNIIPALQSNYNSDVPNAFVLSTEKDKTKNNDKAINPLLDPRMKKDMVNPESPNPYIINIDKTSRSVLNYGNSTSNINVLQNVNSSLVTNVSTGINRTIMSPNLSNVTPNITPNMVSNLAPMMTPIRTQNIPNMTPTARSYDMTPSRQTIDNEDYSNQKHVYAPMFPIVDTRDHIEKQQWDNMDNNGVPFWEDPQTISTHRDTDYRDLRKRDGDFIPAFEHYRNSPRNDRYSFDKIDPCHRTECSTTANHPFGRLDCSKLSTSFGKMDAPMTPVHPFGRSDCPSTPCHPFGRSECPSTPSHPFGRPDPLIPIPFVRPDFNLITNQSFGKPIDQRFKRSSDYDMYHNRDNDREHGFFQDRNFNSSSYKPDQKNRNNNHDSFRKYQREQSLGRNERNKNYDNSSRNYKDSRRETSVGRYNRDYDNDRGYTRNHGSSNRSYDYRQQNEFKNNDKNDRRNYQREKSVSRVTSHLSTKDSTVLHLLPKESHVSVQHHSDNSFTIDTSVNRTFQENNHNRLPSFDARRQRAASVGRILARGSSPHKVVNKESKIVLHNFENKNKNFRRACSVGREIKDSKLDFKDIKADLKSFRLKGESRRSKEETNKEEIRKVTDVVRNCDARSKKEINKSHSKPCQSFAKYSPRQNNRDPRMRRENSHQNSTRDNSRFKTKDSKSYGIVYSNDNITKGTILGQGYGVKNYKIPKIKRPQETVVDKEINPSKLTNNENVEVYNKIDDGINNLSKKIIYTNESNTTRNKIIDSKHNPKESKAELTNSQKESKGPKCDLDGSGKVKVVLTENPKAKDAHDIKQNKSDEQSIDSCKKQEIEEENITNQIVNTSIDNVEKRITRSTSKSLSLDSSLEISHVKRIKRGKKLVHETDSDENIKKIKNTVSDNSALYKGTNNEKLDDIGQYNDVTSKKEDTNSQCVLSTTSAKSKEKKTSGIESGFGMDELEIFADNITSDPVIDNINDLIADLDNDLDSSKPVDTNSNFNRELTLENMLENITSPEDNEKVLDTVDELPEKIETKPDSVISLENKNDPKLFCHNEKSETYSEIETKNNSITSMVESGPNNIKSDLDQNSDSQHKSDLIKLEKNQPLTIENNNDVSESQDENIKNIEMEDNHDNDAIVSTSEEAQKQRPDAQLTSEHNDQKSIVQNKPDSTINSNVTLEILDSDQRNLPDSTNEINCEMNSVISSSHNSCDKINELNADTNSCNTPPPKENISKLLSIKIKELLGLLGDQSSENEKIKKKIEKLSEIVSDDEENSIDNEMGNKKSDFQYEKSDDIGNICPFLEKEKKKEIENKCINNTESLKQSADDIKGSNDKEKCTSKENNLVSEINEESRDDMAVASSEKSNESDNLNEDKDKNSIVPEVNKNKINEQDVSSSKKTQVNAKKPKKGKKGKNIRTVGVSNEEKRLTRSDAANLRFDKQPTVKKPSRELKKLQEDIREMFIRDDILGATGIRMCRLAKLVDETKNQKDEVNNEIGAQEPVVLLKKCNDLNVSDDITTPDKVTKTRTAKGKKSISEQSTSIDTDNPKSKILTAKRSEMSSSSTNIKTNLKDKISDVDPYVFEMDSVNETKNSSDNKNDNDTSDSENESVYSSKSFGSTEILAEVKKKVKRKRTKGWKAGIIKPKHKKKKIDRQPDSVCLIDNSVEILNKPVTVPVTDCFTDRNYCFDKNLSRYECRLCSYNGTDIVCHFKKKHPHSEIPLSRMSPAVALEAIKESEKLNFQVISKVSSKRYICRFCFKEFGGKKPVLESFFWHVVSMHTGEYKQLCSECLNVQRCPFSLDIPPPPKDIKGQLLGYVCEKCNYTQISLENLKSHVIIRHNDEQTAVYTINLSVTAKSIINSMSTEVDGIQNTDLENRLPRVLRSTRSNQSIGESGDVRSDSTDDCNQSLKKESTKSEIENVVKTSNIQSKITFENDNTDEISNYDDIEISSVKIEPLNENQEDVNFDNLQLESEHASFDATLTAEKAVEPTNSNDIFNYAHFKIKYSASGSKEYICCINGNDLHYRTTLLISFKKHVQLKHSEKWDGYCFICKVIVMPQGVHLFKDCLQHFLDQHIDNFPVMEEITEKSLPFSESNVSNETSCENVNTKPYINVRPLSELISQSCTSQTSDASSSSLPVIESVISLGTIEVSRPSPSYPKPETIEVQKLFRHEEAQAEIMSKKHRIVLEAMMSHVKLVKVFKCAGRFCSFTTDSAEDALLHASTHTRVGGEDSLKCAYCDFDSSSNAIDLITHVFKNHGCCQYVCGMCFYRAAASQLVHAHIKRVHTEVSTVKILHTTLQTAPIKEDNILSREEAVPYYLCCASSGSDAPCKFRTYTPGKFCEHLQLRHSTATEHSCFMCPATLSTPADLIRHLKTHGLKLYQCTWCVFGADNETELLVHASANHPDKHPKAYLRIITNKEGTSEFRVLPLAHLNKSDIPAIEVTPSNIKENPVREAERSIELEKLIIHTTFMTESMTDETEVKTKTTENEITCMDSSPQVNEPLLKNMNLLKEPQKRMVTPPPQTIGTENAPQENQLTPILKTEGIETTPEKKPSSDPNIVYCLDSEEEESSPNCIDLCNDQSLNTQINNQHIQSKTLPLSELFLCGKCNVTYKCGAGFKKHVMACYSQIPDPIQCAHCPMKVKKKHIVVHYTKIHSAVSRCSYPCSKCPEKFITQAQVREHERNCHSMNSSNNILNVDKAPLKTQVKPASMGKRKRTLVGKEKPIEPPEKIKRFGPNDVNLLPINPILDGSIFCSLCEFSTKVRLNMVRHLQLHAEQQIVSQTAPVNPVPHLETNEKHFDKMLNLASSSIISRTPDKSKTDSNPTITLMIPPEAASRYPKYVPEKHRHTCGAKGCSYISVDESMFKCHWETLHSGTSDYRCVHCPPHQHLDTSKPLSAVRIIAHLKMHDATLYACSVCSYYHYKRQILETHLNDIHKAIGQVMVVREEGVTLPVNTCQTQVSAPTMDLKPWQCGLCKFKSLLCPEVVDHCAKIHNSKMQYKCAYCAFKTSNSENITKHQKKSHSDKPEEIFYYYYREGSVPAEPDGTPVWQKQCQKYDLSKSAIKSEVTSDVCLTPQISVPISKPSTMDLDLNLVKTEVIEPVEDSIDELCRDFGEFCEPNGLKYKCSLCKNVVEDSIDAMQSHLYEELKYRKWGCSICSYKAFHKAGLNGHMQTEHRQNKEPIALQVDKRVETWVAKLLEYQTELIEKNKENLAKQKEEIYRTAPGPSRPKSPPKRTAEFNEMKQSSSNTDAKKTTMLELVRLFGPLGASVNMSFCCPKCHSIFKDEESMKNHLESELNKIRWFCSNCSVTYQTYHEAQFHCRSEHPTQSARPVEVIRDASVRSAWVDGVIRVQKLSMNYVPLPSKSFGNDTDHSEEKSDNPENSLLVVLYEEKIPTPEEQMVQRTSALNTDSDDDKLVIDEPKESRKARSNICPHCTYQTINARVSRAHVLRHYNLRPFMCSYCGLDGSRKAIEQHQKNVHLNQPIKLICTPIPAESPLDFLQNKSSNLHDTTKLVCLVCRNAFTEAEAAVHSHDNIPTSFGKKGDVVVKCSVCLTLHKDINAYFNHHQSVHNSASVNYVFDKLSVHNESKVPKSLTSSDQKLSLLRDKMRNDSSYNSKARCAIVPKLQEPFPKDVVIDLDDEDDVETERETPVVSHLPSSRKVARKSTTKLPYKRPFAKKSTTKLPFNVSSEPQEFSYYGTRPSYDDLDGVTTMMTFCNTMMPFTLKKLSAIININPVVELEMLK